MIAELARGLGIDEGELATSLAAAQARWPQLPALDADYLVLRKQGSGAMQIEDLVLAWWCSTGDSVAITAFEVAHADVIDRLIYRFHRLDADELRQRLRVKLFVDGRIRDYSGYGRLENWVKIVAARVFVDVARTRDRAEPLPDDFDAAVSGLDPRQAAARAQVVAAVKRALDQAIAALPPRERTYLRHVLVDGLTLDQIAATYQVSRMTVSRTLATARAGLHDATRGLVIAELGSLSSMLPLLDSQIDLSLQRLFPEPTL